MSKRANGIGSSQGNASTWAVAFYSYEAVKVWDSRMEICEDAGHALFGQHVSYGTLILMRRIYVKERRIVCADGLTF